MLLTHEFVLDASKKGVQKSIPVTQNDISSHRLLITLRNGALPVELHPGDVAVIEAVPNIHETAILHDSNDEAMPNTVEYIPSTAVTTAPGTLRLVVKIYEEGSSLMSYCSPEFEFVVRKDLTADSDIATSNPYTAVIRAQVLAEGYAQSAYENAKTAKESAQMIADVIEEMRYPDTEAEKVYSVRFIGSVADGVREDSAVGLIAEVAVDAEKVRNDFDNIPFYSRPICNCYWDTVNRKWVVRAYKGDPTFAWDGSNGEVMYECTPFYYKIEFDGDYAPSYVSVTAVPRIGYKLAPLFKNGVDKVYCPCFEMASYGGKATSRAGLSPEWGSLNTLTATARTFDVKAHVEPIEAVFSDLILQYVEFATKDLKGIMAGCSNLINKPADTIIKALNDTQFEISSAVGEALVIGQSIQIGKAKNGADIASSVEIKNVVTSGDVSTVTLNSSVSGLGAGQFITSTMFRTGAAAIAVRNASSGSPVSNTDAKHPCIWRGKENPWGNGLSTISNLLVNLENGARIVYYLQKSYLYNISTKLEEILIEDYISTEMELPATGTGHVAKLGIPSEELDFIMLPVKLGGSATSGACMRFLNAGTSITLSQVHIGGCMTENKGGAYSYNIGSAPTTKWNTYGARLFLLE